MRRFADDLTLTRAAGGLVVVLGVIAMADQLIDPSFLTHLTTGGIALDRGFPRSDPYTFTAAGEPWVVQSWLAGISYASLDRLLGLEAIRAVVAVLGGVVAAGTWVLTRPAQSLTPRLGLSLLVVAIGFNGWSERPLIVGLVGLVVLLLVTEQHANPVVLVPVTYIWVNAHGSWPLGVGLVILLAVGRRLDGGSPSVELRTLRWMGLGLVVSLANPYGWRILTFPVELLQRREALSHIIEWRAPTYGRPSEQLFLVLVAVALLAAARRRAWRSALPQLVFVALAATGARNVVPASIVLACFSAPALAGWGSIDGDRKGIVPRAVAATAAGLAAVAAVGVVVGDPLDESIYPVAAEQWLEEHELSPAEHRVVAREAVGNWWEFRYGATQSIFIDDRIEVLPLQVVEDHTALLEGDSDWEEILDRYEPEAVVWEVEEPLADLLAESDRWQVTHRDRRYLVAVPVAGD